MNRKPKTLAQTMGLALAKSVVAFALVAIGFVTMAHAANVQALDSESGAADGKPLAVGSPAQILDTNDCWTGSAPADVKTPGHVVFRTDGDARLGGPKAVGQALEQIFDGVDHGMTVYGFCR